MTSVSPALSSPPAPASSSGTTTGSPSGSPDTFRSTLDREMAGRSSRRPANSSAATKPHRTDPHAAHRPDALRGRGGSGKGGVSSAKGTGDATPTEPGTPPQAGTSIDTADGSVVAGSDAIAAMAAAQQLTPPTADLRVALALPGGTPASTGDAVAASAAKGTTTSDAQVPAQSQPTGTQADGSGSPATATSIVEALAADPTTTGAAPSTTTGGTSGGSDPSAGQPSPSDQPPASDQPGLPTATAGSSTAAAPTPSDSAAAPAPVTPATITAAAAGEVAEAASNAATAALLNATGAAAPLPTPDVLPTTSDSAANRTAAALPSHVAELARLARISADGTARLTVRLDPPELGAVTLHLTSRGSAVELSLRAETPAGAAALAGQQARVRDLLAEHGFDLSNFTITGVGSADETGSRDPRQRDANGSFPDGNGSGENRFSAETNSGDRGSSRSTFADTDGFGSGGRPGSRADDGWPGDVPPAEPSIAGTPVTEGTWL